LCKLEPPELYMNLFELYSTDFTIGIVCLYKQNA
jgi:hypothetical protein